MSQMSAILQDIDNMTEDLEKMKKHLLVNVAVERDNSKEAWDKIRQAGRQVKWDNVSAVDEIRMQRGNND